MDKKKSELEIIDDVCSTVEHIFRSKVRALCTTIHRTFKQELNKAGIPLFENIKRDEDGKLHAYTQSLQYLAGLQLLEASLYADIMFGIMVGLSTDEELENEGFKPVEDINNPDYQEEK